MHHIGCVGYLSADIFGITQLVRSAHVQGTFSWQPVNTFEDFGMFSLKTEPVHAI